MSKVKKRHNAIKYCLLVYWHMHTYTLVRNLAENSENTFSFRCTIHLEDKYGNKIILLSTTHWHITDRLPTVHWQVFKTVHQQVFFRKLFFTFTTVFWFGYFVCIVRLEFCNNILMCTCWDWAKSFRTSSVLYQ